MSSKVISPSFKLIGVDGSIAISVRSVLAETGAFARFGSEVLNVVWSWFAWGPHEHEHARPNNTQRRLFR
ncbi:hypothetical protein PILCRDRAFT_16549 [Piloderma croceum F 1598]|uniref:Uncharacterized protein n=1 Tax=Piloderma croceum (strain F 1598) TaxID=765440 RepID=A0A0C3B3Y0_PILCF|nr:hypothetical protein PILCRDRAFT_16549 [Piloderma croceum F 1598]